MNRNFLLRFLGKSLWANIYRLNVRTVTLTIVARAPQPISKEYEEVQIPVPWGHIAGKWWGPKNKRPVLMIHGWQDNCGTFNALVPYLPNNIGLLAIDLPGHGLSSHIPLGLYSLHGIEDVLTIRRIVQYFKWDSVSIMAHSMATVNAFCYAAFYPKTVDLLVSFDPIKTVHFPYPVILDYMSRRIDKFLKIDFQIASHHEPPLYTYDEMIERIYLGSNKAIDLDKCHHLAERNTKISPKDPSKYYFSRDARLKVNIMIPMEKQLTAEMAKTVKCPILAIRGAREPRLTEATGYDEIVNVLKEHNPLYKCVELADGSHYVHLNNSEKVASLTNEYLHKFVKHLFC